MVIWVQSFIFGSEHHFIEVTLQYWAVPKG